jgi:hypothetical protein
MKIREYKNYNEYIKHQSSKLKPAMEEIIIKDQKIEESVFNRYKDFTDFSNKSVLCLAARLGGEVRAFKKLNALAIGIDIQPGDKNKDVLHGDFHNINTYKEIESIPTYLNDNIFNKMLKIIPLDEIIKLKNYLNK